MNFFSRAPKVVFECLIPEVARLMPMVEAKTTKHAWAKRAAMEFTEDRKHPEFGMHKKVYTARCPGIFNLQRHGWVMRTWQDITIETFGDGSRFEWTSPINQKSLCEKAGEYVGFHPDLQLANYMENWPASTIRTLLKLQTPWRCTVPKGYYLMEMPIAYADENRFTVLNGYFSHEQGPAQMNPQFLWHVMNGKTLIKAGTPIAQYILVPKTQYEMEVRPLGECTEESFFEVANHHRFIKNYAEIKRIYGE
jgi:hypothetical protein